MIPGEAIEAALEVFWANEDEPYMTAMKRALEAALPHLLSHEREETRLAHLDAVVNAETVDRLQAAIQAVLAYGADREKYTDTGDPKVDAAIKSYAYHVRRVMSEAWEATL